ncbi:carbohydrate kinase family protein [Methanobacterium petrolearium]|uniref:carbohydrate kinase family protein n=1 Tax=Methanobacterium petrolearium TaxID=710190 RepID=UPI001AE1B5A8|nr:carbohydrate kinase family protein [Methanobacterium petrolearium]MBP1945285.1 ribokinase [Methanobacterium petrolearium]BDZ71237.1 ribokinase [Methanobacterium petrolearium]
MKLDVVGFGALNLDRLFQVNRIACKEEEGQIKNLHESCGGSAANTIIGLARLGLDTGFIGKIASDREGETLLDNLKNEDVDIQGIIKSSGGRSGTVHGYVDRKGERALYVDPGVNDSITTPEIDLEYASNTRLLHLTSFVGKSIEAQEELLENIPNQITVSLDPGMIYASKGLKVLQKILQRTNILLINQNELNLLLRSKKGHDPQINTLLNYGIEIIVVKQGKKGCLVTDGIKTYLLDAFGVDCRDTTGAGDAFNSGFIYGFLEGKNIEESAMLGNFVASCCVQELGATTGLPSKSVLGSWK